MKSLVLFCAILAIGVGSAHADGDGFFCASSKFLAYEPPFNGPGNQHKLYVVYFGKPFSAEPLSIQIPHFTVHRMNCSDSQVEILSWDNRYTFSVSSTALVMASEAKLPAPGSFPKGSREPDNLGAWSPVSKEAGPQRYTFKLQADDPVYKYELRIQKLDTKNHCRVAITTDLVKVDGKGEIKESREVYKDGEVPTECGE